jgi:hypothetical protein
MTLPLKTIDKITNKLIPSESFKELKKDYTTLPLKITDGLRASESSEELRRNYMILPLKITNRITNRKKFCRKNLGGFGKS